MLRAIALTLALLSIAPAEADEYLVGTAIGNVTPERQTLVEGNLYMGGYGLWKSRGPATDIHDPLSVRAMCIERGTGSFCLAIADSLGITGPMAERIATLARLKGVPRETAILVSATHTHAAPDLLGLWGGAPAAYSDSLVEEAVNTIAAAYRAMVPSRLYRATTTAPAFNRRGWDFTDNVMGIIVVRDPANTIPLATLVNFAAHPVTTPAANLAISSDFVHYFRKTLADQNQAPAIFINGALGDVTPGARDADYWQGAATYGEDLARAAGDAIDEAQEIDGEILVEQRTTTLRVDNWTLIIANMFGLLSEDLTGPPWDRTVKAQVSYIRIGNDVEIVATPGEPLTRLGLSLKSLMSAPLKMVFGQTNGSLGYFVPLDEWETNRNNNYEESVSLGRETAPALYRLILEMLR